MRQSIRNGLIAGAALAATLCGPAHAEKWIATDTSDAFGLGQDFIDADSLRKQPDGRYYFRAKSVMRLGSKTVTDLDQYRVDCAQDMGGDYDEIAVSEKRGSAGGKASWTDNDSLSAGSGAGQLIRYACRSLAKVPAPKPFAPSAAEQALCDAAKNGEADRIAALAAGHLAAASCDKDGSQALHLAVLYDKPETVQALLQAGAPANGRTKKGQTPLMNVKSVAVAGILLDHGARVTAQDLKGETPLHDVGIQALGEHREGDPPEQIAEFLLAHGANVNAVDKAGEPPLFTAAASGKVALVQTLLDHGADAKFTEKNGESALDRAKLAKAIGALYADRPDAYDPPEHFDAVIALLAQHGAPEKPSGAKTP